MFWQSDTARIERRLKQCIANATAYQKEKPGQYGVQRAQEIIRIARALYDQSTVLAESPETRHMILGRGLHSGLPGCPTKHNGASPLSLMNW